MLRSTRAMLLLLPALGVLHPAGAVTPQRRELTVPGTLERGWPEGVSITSEGTLRLAPRIREIPLHPEGGNPQSFVWCQATDSRGRLYVGTGNEGRVFRVTPSEGSRPFFQTPEIEVTAIAVDEKDHLYVAASPPARIYHLTPEGKGDLFFESEERYIWALARNSRGELYAATGDRGILFRISKEGRGTAVLDSEDPHIVSLAMDEQDNLYAGTAGRGIVYRIRDAGGTRVVYESGADEVSALEISPQGTLFIALLEKRPRERKGPGPPETVRRKPEEEEEGPLPGLPPAGLEKEVLPVRPPTGISPRREELPERRPIRSRLLAFSPRGWTRTLWEEDGEILFSLLLTGDGLHAGTGRAGTRFSGKPPDPGEEGDPAGGFGGTLREFDGAGGSTLIARLRETQVTSLSAPGRGGLYAGTSNLGNLYWVDRDPVESGTFTSSPVDAGMPARWGRIWWRGEAPPGSRVNLSTRTGNTARPDGTWSPWSVAGSKPEGNPVGSPPGRYLQWKAEIRGPSPEVREVWISYIQENVPPSVRNLKIHPPGNRTGGTETGKPQGNSGRPEPSRGESEPEAPDEAAESAGFYTVAWDGEDPNGDEVSYDLLIREEGKAGWKELARGLRRNRFPWDTGLLPDGRYRLRVVARDTPDNPPGEVLTSETLSEVFLNDHTPPEVRLQRPKVERNRLQVEGVVTDNLSGIASLRYSLDRDRWTPVFPKDGICDSDREEVRILLEDLPAGDHVLHLRAKDAKDNVGSGQIPFTVAR